MKVRSNARKLKAAETKKRIYECTMELMRRYGLDNFTVDDVVEAAGVSKGTFYVHFKSKFSLRNQITSFLSALKTHKFAQC